MAKNNSLINRYKAMYQQIQKITPEVYSALAIALHRKYGWGYKRINDLFCESQEIWSECINSNINMVQMCYEETGIDVQRKVE